ncbi:MAG: hypothetical protein V4689_16575 [Verrucomicrobiota bacterium]
MILALLFLLPACGPGNGPTMLGTETDPAQSGLGFLPKNAEKGRLFTYYQPRAASAWRNNWTSTFDLTGVSLNDPAAATLIAPNYVLMAAHFIRNPHSPIMFHDKKGNPCERYVTEVRSLPGYDVAVCKLNLPAPPEIKCYRFANVADASIGRPVIVTDKDSVLSVHRIDAVSGASIRFSHIPGLNPVYQRNLITGDSGHPSFIVKSGDLFLIETHTTGGPGAGPFYGDPQLQAAIRTAMVEMGN